MDAQKHVFKKVKVFIYALNCPITGTTRYVGKTTDPASRFRQHISCSDRRNNHRTCWLRSLASRGLKPTLEILDEVPVLEWPQWEVAYIEYFREAGCDLVNSTAGGNAPEMTSEIRAKIGAAQKGEKNHFFGKKFKPEHIAKIVAANTGKKRSPEYCARLGDKHRGKKASSELLKKLSDGHTGIKLARNKSGFVGVCWDKWTKRWKTHFKQIQLGAFYKIEDAVFVRALYAAVNRPS